jgi:hypothetical protein
MTEQRPQPRLLLRREALAYGWSDEELSRLTRRNEWTRLRRGVYLDGPVPADAVLRHRRLIQATAASLLRPAVFSHQSAAVLHGFRLWGVGLGQVHVTRRPRASTGSTRSLRTHVARFREDEVTAVEGLPVTDPVRTALDLARSLPFEPAVVVLDAALHVGLVSAADLQRRLFDIAGTRGSRHAARVVRFVDARSESVGESRSRVLLQQLALPSPALQYEIRTGSGLLVARTDFAWEEQRVVGEFDGRVKYGRLLRPGQEPGEAVFEEKLREDAIREEGWGVVRWTWSDLVAPRRFEARIQRALTRSTA